MNNRRQSALRIAIQTLCLMIFGFGSLCLGQEVRPDKQGTNLSYLDNGIIRVGADLDHGGSIGFLADVKKSGNVINVHDLGRWIGQSYYSGPKPFGTTHPAWKNWPWNPVSAGDVYGNSSKLIEKKNDGKTLYIKSIPMQWALKNVPGECHFETWITLEGRSVHVRNRLTNDRKDHNQYPSMDQELPAVYTIGKLHRLMTYTGDTPFTDSPLQEIPKKQEKGNQPQWTTFFATEHWAALVNDDDWGLGIIHPDVVRFVGGFYGKANTGGPNDDPNGYVAPVRQEILDHNILYDFQYTLVLDTLTNIRKEAYRQRPQTNLPDYHFKNDRQHWWFQNAEDSGYPFKEGLHLKMEKNDPQLYGPEAAWNSKDVPKLYIRAAFRTKNSRAQLFWQSADRPGFPPDQNIRFDIVPDGMFRTYEVDLSASPAYQGTIRRLRLDPVETGNIGETVNLEFISAFNR